MVTHPASTLAQDRESSPAETSVLTTMLRRQLVARRRVGITEQKAGWLAGSIIPQSASGCRLTGSRGTACRLGQADVSRPVAAAV